MVTDGIPLDGTTTSVGIIFIGEITGVIIFTTLTIIGDGIMDMHGITG